MSENMEKFLAVARKDEELTAKLVYAGKEEVVEIAKSVGHDITVGDMEAMEAELKAAMKTSAKTREKGELSDDELDSVAGGAEIFKSVFHKYCWMVRLTDAEVARFEAKGYTLVSNGAYKKGDYFDVLIQGKSIVDVYSRNPEYEGDPWNYALSNFYKFAIGQINEL